MPAVTGPAAFADRLALEMIARGYGPILRRHNQAAFARRCGITRSTVRRALTGTERPTITTIGKIAMAFDMPVQPLLVLCGYIEDVEPLPGDE